MRSKRFINCQGDKRVEGAQEIFIGNYPLTEPQKKELEFYLWFDSIQRTNISLEQLVNWENIQTNLTAYEKDSIPPLLSLGKLLAASNRVLQDSDTDEDLRLILAPGSSLGGARPKASVLDKDGHLAIAKFPKKDDEIDVIGWEAVALTLATKANITTPQWRLESIRKRYISMMR